MSKTNKNESAIEPARSAAVLPSDAAMADVAERLIDQARNDGLALTGAGGLLTGLVQQVLQASLESELTEHLGYLEQIREHNAKQAAQNALILAADAGVDDLSGPQAQQIVSDYFESLAFRPEDYDYEIVATITLAAVALGALALVAELLGSVPV